MNLSYLAKNPARPRHVFFLSALSLADGVATALMPAGRIEMRIVFAGTGLVLFLLLESYALRYTAVSFRYEIHENTFLVFRLIRGREKPVLSFPLREIRTMYPVRSSPPGLKRNACPTLRGRRIAGTAVFYGEQARPRAVVIECSYEFARALSREAVAAGAGSAPGTSPGSQ